MFFTSSRGDNNYFDIIFDRKLYRFAKSDLRGLRERAM